MCALSEFHKINDTGWIYPMHIYVFKVLLFIKSYVIIRTYLCRNDHISIMFLNDQLQIHLHEYT